MMPSASPRSIVARSLLFLAAIILSGCRGPVDRVVAVESSVVGTEYGRGVVAADHALGSQAGVRMLRRGGNAVDAAVAAAFVQGVVRPYSCGLGGGGFMVIHLRGPSVVELETPLEEAALPADDAAPAADPADAVADVPDEEDPEVAARLARHRAGRASFVIDYRETAPAAIGPTYYEDLDLPRASRTGGHASGVPGSVAGLLYALEHFGRIDRRFALGPAIEIAEHGFRIDAHYVRAARGVIDRLERDPDLRVRLGDEGYRILWETYLFSGDPREGDVLRQPRLADALRRIATAGPAAFYAGAIAEAIADVSPVIAAGDLARYEVNVGEPLRGTYAGREFLVMPPPSSGGVAMLQTLGLLERLEERGQRDPAGPPTDPLRHHLLAESLKHAFADRASWLADPAFASVPVDRLLADDYLDDLAARIEAESTQAPSAYGSRRGGAMIEDGGTSHISVVDSEGNAVAVTETINTEFGSLFVVPEFGLILNNEMDDFLTVRGETNVYGLEQAEANLPAPGKRPLSSMSPTIVLDADDRVEMVAGASGGPRIITGTLQVLLHAIDHGDDPATAVVRPRLHHQWRPDTLYVEESWTDEAALADLERRGHSIARRRDIGVVQFVRVRIDPDTGAWSARAASDPRKGGAPAGW